MKSKKFVKIWLVATVASASFFGAMEIRYENFAKATYAMQVTRPIDTLDIPGREANRLALRLATKITKEEELTQWDYSVRLSLLAIVLTCSIASGYIVAFCWRPLNPRDNEMNPRSDQ